MFGDLAGLLLHILQLVPALLLAAIFMAQIVWQCWQVAKNPNGWIKLNALAILGTTALLFMPPYEGYAALSRAINVSLLPLPFILIACFTDPMPKKLLPIAHAIMTVLLFGIFVTSSN